MIRTVSICVYRFYIQKHRALSLISLKTKWVWCNRRIFTRLFNKHRYVLVMNFMRSIFSRMVSTNCWLEWTKCERRSLYKPQFILAIKKDGRLVTSFKVFFFPLHMAHTEYCKIQSYLKRYNKKTNEWYVRMAICRLI